MRGFLLILLLGLGTVAAQSRYGYFFIPRQTVAAGTVVESNEVHLSAGEVMSFGTSGAGDQMWGHGENPRLAYFREGESDPFIEVLKTSSHHQLTYRKIMGPCSLKLFSDYPAAAENAGPQLLVYKIDPLGQAVTASVLAVPANAGNGVVEILLQQSNDGITWSNTNGGNYAGSSALIMFRLVMIGAGNVGKRVNAAFGYGYSEITSQVFRSIHVPAGVNSHSVSIAAGEVFHLHSHVSDDPFNVKASSIEVGAGTPAGRQTVSMNYEVGEYSYDGRVAGRFPGPATLSIVRGGERGTAAVLNYYITTDGTGPDHVYSGAVTLPAGAGTYRVAVLTSEDLLNWSEWTVGSALPDSSRVRFFRVSAVLGQ